MPSCTQADGVEGSLHSLQESAPCGCRLCVTNMQSRAESVSNSLSFGVDIAALLSEVGCPRGCGEGTTTSRGASAALGQDGPSRFVGFLAFLAFLGFLAFLEFLGFVGFVGFLGFIGFIGSTGFLGFHWSSDWIRGHFGCSQVRSEAEKAAAAHQRAEQVPHR